MASPISFATFAETLLPTGEVVRKETAGQYFYCTEANGSFQMRLDDGRWFDFDQSFAFPFPSGFTSVSFRAASGATQQNSIRFYVTSGEVVAHLNTIRNPVNYQSSKFFLAPTVAKGFAAATIAAGESVVLYGTGGAAAHQAGALYSYRKSVIVTNNDPGSNLEIYAVDGTTRLATVFNNQAWQLETSEDLIVKNQTGAPINCRICELFYPAV
jgi:hypothetical protein